MGEFMVEVNFMETDKHLLLFEVQIHTSVLIDHLFGFQKGQLGRQEDVSKDKWGPWYALPGLVPGIGQYHSLCY